MKEQAVMHHILLACGKAATLFRQNVGFAWVSKGEPVKARRTMTITLQPGDVVLRQANMIRMGLCEGSSDIIGFRSRVVQPEDVGQRVAVFAAIEVKTETGRVRPMQQEFIDLVVTAGGIAGVARNETEAAELLGTTC